MNQSVSQSINPSINPSISQSVSQTVNHLLVYNVKTVNSPGKEDVFTDPDYGRQEPRLWPPFRRRYSVQPKQEEENQEPFIIANQELDKPVSL